MSEYPLARNCFDEHIDKRDIELSIAATVHSIYTSINARKYHALAD